MQDAWLPPPLKKDGLYQLDVDQDIWLDYDPSHFEEVPPWLADTSVKEGIPFAQMVVNCRSEIAQCEAEHSNLHQWLSAENHRATKLYYATLQSDVDIALFPSCDCTIFTS